MSTLRKLGSLVVTLGALVFLPAVAAQRAELRTLKDVRFWSVGEVIRIAIETDGEVQYRSEHIDGPDRIFLDLSGVRPGQRKIQVIQVGDKVLKQIRIAETMPGTTRIVLDLAAPAEYVASQLTVPDRIIIEVRPRGQSAPQPPARSISGHQSIEPPAAIAPSAVQEMRPAVAVKPEAPTPAPVIEQKPVRSLAVAAPMGELAASGAGTQKDRPLAKPAAPSEDAPAAVKPSRTPDLRSVPDEPGIPAAAKRDSQGTRSLTRVLGLKMRRVVLDPGHGGHDTGTIGPGGYMEKELVLDVTKRLAVLIRKRTGLEVVLTREDDTFIPLHERTAIANSNEADLFVSIHANSSRQAVIAGPETFYMSMTSSPEELDVAARENASSTKSIFELEEQIKKIARNEKFRESREFADNVQKAMYTGWVRGKGVVKNRGVKKAPFVVLLEAHMPSVLAEIAFLSNPREEKLLRRGDYRQRLADALFKGVAQYASTLSHFEVASEKKF
jgi:N-acetylmuramoyl-L-alanine amidase